jgi:Skp family chaperone for outer membrane proteins
MGGYILEDGRKLQTDAYIDHLEAERDKAQADLDALREKLKAEVERLQATRATIAQRNKGPHGDLARAELSLALGRLSSLLAKNEADAR